jgi:hypothetical protein
MLRFFGLMSLVVFTSLVAGAVPQAGEIGAIKRFKSFPVDTYELNGRLSDFVLEEDAAPPVGEISVDGYWPDRKLLLISFQNDAHYVLFRAVEMNDQPNWDVRMAASGGLVCSGRSARRTGGNPNSSTAATKGFISPC